MRSCGQPGLNWNGPAAAGTCGSGCGRSSWRKCWVGSKTSGRRARLALFSASGFDPALRRRAKTDRVVLVDFERLYART
jgi:hypothetical protein